MRRIIELSLIATLLCSASFLAAAERPASTGRMVSIEVVIAQFADGQKDLDLALDSGEKALERINELEKQGQIGQLTRMRLTTLDQYQARLQLGERAPVATGRSRTAAFGRAAAGDRGGPSDRPAGGGGPVVTTNYSIQNVGTQIGVTPQVEDDGSVSLKMEIEKSNIVPPSGSEPAADALDIPPSRTATLVTQSTVRLRSGQTAIVGQSQTSAKGESGQSVILVTAHVSDAPATAHVPAAASQQEIKIFALRNLQAQESAAVLTSLFKDADLQIEADVRTNSVLIRGPQNTLSEIEAILSRLDQQVK